MGSARDALAGFAPSARAGPVTPEQLPPATLAVRVTLVSGLLCGREGPGSVQPGSRQPRCCRGCDGNPTSWNAVTGSAASPAVPPQRPACHLFLQVAHGRVCRCPGQSQAWRGRCRCAVGGLSLMPPLPQHLPSSLLIDHRLAPTFLPFSLTPAAWQVRSP